MSEHPTPEAPHQTPRWRRVLAIISLFGAGFCAYQAAIGFLQGNGVWQVAVLSVLAVVLFACGCKLVPPSATV